MKIKKFDERDISSKESGSFRMTFTEYLLQVPVCTGSTS